MSDAFTTFELGSVIVPIHSAFELSQTYEPLGGFVTIRMLNGAALKQQNWEKIGTTIQGTSDSIWSGRSRLFCIAVDEVCG